MADEKKVLVENEDGDTAEINLNNTGDVTNTESSVENAAEVPTDLTETLKAEIERLKGELNEKQERYMRLQADFDNFRKRTAKEKTELAATIEQAFLKDLLPLLDNLSRATDAAETGEESNVETLKKGIEMINQETVAVMGKHGLEPIDTEGKTFDPNFHQAVARVADPEREEGTIAAELQRGYIARGRVIRPSMVQVVSND